MQSDLDQTKLNTQSPSLERQIWDMGFRAGLAKAIELIQNSEKTTPPKRSGYERSGYEIGTQLYNDH